MSENTGFSLLDLAKALAMALDLIDTRVSNHHMQVGYMALRIAEVLGMDVEDRRDLMNAALLHDIGAFSLQERLDLSTSFDIRNAHRHAARGSWLLKHYKLFSNVSEIVRYHHVPWREGLGTEFNGRRVPFGSHILHLIDRVTALIDSDQEILGQTSSINKRIVAQSNKMLAPDLVDAFQNASERESFWIEATSPFIQYVLNDLIDSMDISLDWQEFFAATQSLSRLVDFRSSYSAMHSRGVAAVALILGEFLGLPDRECQKMRVAGFLHDLGKITVPSEILDTAIRLSEEHFYVIRKHAYYTFMILEKIHMDEELKKTAASHHERLNGSGYPFRLQGKTLSLQARLVAVADVFTAMTEDRPYRKGLLQDETIQILKHLAGESILDNRVVSVLVKHFHEINNAREIAKSEALDEYNAFDIHRN